LPQSLACGRTGILQKYLCEPSCLFAVEIVLPFRADLTQQHGFLHAGIVATILDSACGYAAFSLMPANMAVLAVEFKIVIARRFSPKQSPGFHGDCFAEKHSQ
jgi:hypothetical protein